MEARADPPTRRADRCELPQVLLVSLVWVWAVPLLTYWMWRLGFTTSLSHGLRTVYSRLSPLLLLADCIQASPTPSVSQTTACQTSCSDTFAVVRVLVFSI